MYNPTKNSDPLDNFFRWVLYLYLILYYCFIFQNELLAKIREQIFLCDQVIKSASILQYLNY